MSKLYDKSKNYYKFFEQQTNFEKELSEFSFYDNSLHKPKKYNKCVPFVGLGGVPLSGDGNHSESVYVDYSDSHTLIIGPTGSKKSRLIAMPMVRILGESQESMIVCDPKAEIYNRTSGYLLDCKYRIYVLNLRDPNYGDCWNPLAIAYEFFKNNDIDRAYELVNDIVTNIAYREKATNDPFWDNSFASLLLGLIMFLFKFCKENQLQDSDVNIGNVIELRKKMFSGYSNKILDSKLWKYASQDIFIETALLGTVMAPEGTRRSILSTFDEKMRIFTTQPNLLKMLSVNNINYNSLLEKSTAIFLILPDEKTSYHGLVSLFVKQSYEYMIYLMQKNSVYHKRVNYVLDEFSSLPTINDFAAMITAARSRNIRFNIIIQSKHQLLLRYKDDTDTIQSNCNNWVFLTSRELAILNEISQLGGNSFENGIMKPVLSVSDLQRLDKDEGEVIILRGRKKPYITRLPDIEKYDKNKYKSVSLHRINEMEIKSLNFDALL